MKIMKAVKKLKFWSRKKNKRQIHSLKAVEAEPSRPALHYHYHYRPVQPSAPPLPSWMDYEDQPEMEIAPEIGVVSGLASLIDSRCELLNSVPEANQSHSAVMECNSYQQYMVPNPVYVPIVPEVQRERAGRAFACAINIGAYLIRCFFPCFHVREVK
ncbi:hypothetical protein LIER_07049 [Lithospermum erythrorhizon]|uniref:Uncharacterized protein n=1 Tax=Lithospermum erythrorhizon TaxID=34254 RepID=A0AAV3P724_LITER